MKSSVGWPAVWVLFASVVASGCSSDDDGDDDGCPADRTECGSECVDTSSDTDHCGRCDHRCAAEQVCEDGSCVDPDGPGAAGSTGTGGGDTGSGGGTVGGATAGGAGTGGRGHPVLRGQRPDQAYPGLEQHRQRPTTSAVAGRTILVVSLTRLRRETRPRSSPATTPKPAPDYSFRRAQPLRLAFGRRRAGDPPESGWILPTMAG